MKAAAIKRLVLDASVAVAWCLPDEHTAYGEGVLDLLASGIEAVVPAIWPFEVANALLVSERRKRTTAQQVTSILERISDFPITVDPIRMSRAFGTILLLARQEELTEYDAAYIDLALREGLPLATLDDRLGAAARNVGIGHVEI
jgi:predicted nucleic acid-binding protein